MYNYNPIVYENNNINRKQGRNNNNNNNDYKNKNHMVKEVQVNRRDGASQKGTQSTSKEYQDVFKKDSR